MPIWHWTLLEMGIWGAGTAANLTGLLHHSDCGVQDRAIRCPQRLEEADAVASVGSKRDSYDNAFAKAFGSLLKAELIRNKCPGGIGHLKFAVAD